MKHNRLITIASLLIFGSVALTAQVARPDTVVQLKNWATPLYWQPNQKERDAATQAIQQNGITPRLVFSSNQVSANALTFIAISPCRLIDTRGAAGNFNGVSPFSGPSISAGMTATVSGTVLGRGQRGHNAGPLRDDSIDCPSILAEPDGGSRCRGRGRLYLDVAVRLFATLRRDIKRSAGRNRGQRGHRPSRNGQRRN